MPGHLPEERGGFVGRHDELRGLVGALAAHRLVTLTGVGGVGKTRLALRAAVGGPDETAWADLSPLRNDELLMATVSDAVGLVDHTPRMPAEALCGWLADKRLLLVLDSCEHLLPQCRRLVERLLREAPGVRVLATSRQALDLPGEHLLAVHPLPLPAPGATEDEAGDGALTLFLRRAAEAVPDGPEPDAHWREAAAEVCRRLDGIPLALELAARRLDGRTVDELAGELRARAGLEADERGFPHRHGSLWTALGWSHELCSPRERLVWARLSVLRGPFDAATAVAVCGAPPLQAADVGEALAGLAGCSVLHRDGERYRMLDTLREYGRMWLDELGETAALADRHARHFLSLARVADAHWLSPGQAEWYRRVAQAHPDLCAAIDHFYSGAAGPASLTDGLDLAGRVGFLWSCCGHLHEARSYLQRGLVLHAAPGPARTRALWALGVTTLLQGETETAAELEAACARAAEADEDPELLLASAYLTGLLHLLTGRPHEARATSESALAAVPGKVMESPSRLRCHLVEVFALTALGELDQARTTALRLLGPCQDMGEVWTSSYLEYQLALIALFQDRPRDAAAHARAMLRGKQRLGDSFGIALGLDVLAAARAAEGDSADAATISGTSRAYWRTVGHPQRGTPELGPVRRRTEERVRADLGAAEYDRMLHRGADDLPRGLDLALGTG